MATKDPQLVKAILAAEGIAAGTTTWKKQQNTIKAVTEILKSLLDDESRELILNTISTKASGAGGSSIGIGGVSGNVSAVGGGNGNNSKFPSFNVRTPIVEVILNGIPLYPNKVDIETGAIIKNAKLNFQDFQLSMPLGGVEKTITGTISFFTKNPEELLAYLNVGVGNVSSGSDFSTSGLPTMTIKFGWAFSDSTTASKISKALTPQLTFIVTNIAMTDPGVGGTTFTLSIQELGTIVLQHSSDDLLFDSDYPQQQIRSILEGLLHVRLFTLDDLLFLGENNGVPKKISSSSPPSPPKTDITTPALAVPNIATGGTIPGTGSVIHLPGTQGTPSNTTKFQTNISGGIPQVAGVTPSPTVVLSDKTGSKIPSNAVPLAALTGGNMFTAAWDYFKPGGTLDQSKVGKAILGTAEQAGKDVRTFQEAVGIATKPVSATPATTPGAAPASIKPDQTCFITQPGPPIGVNGKNFFTLCSELASQCRCLWYPHDNTKEDANAAIKESSEAVSRLTELQRDLNTIKSLPSGAISDEAVNASIAKIMQDDKTISGGTAPTYTTFEAEAIIKAERDKISSRLATRSTLFWIPNIPADWETSDSRYYATGANQEHTAVPYEEGAFFLLPDILDDYDIFTKDLPVQYGPGASKLPYFYGSGQNVFQVSLGAKNMPKLFGEVISIAVTHNNLMVALAQSADEKLAYAVNGKRIGQLESAINYKATNNPSKKQTFKMTPSEKAAATIRATERGNLLLSTANAGQASLIAQFKSRRFKHALALGRGGTLDIFDSDTLDGPARSIGGQDTPNGTSSGPAQSASYKIKSRVATFLRYPTQAKISILGDPNLMRLGPGCFELFSYYPVEHNNGTVTQELNSLVSGLYFVTKIEHALGADGYITSLEGSKTVDPMNVPSSITGRIFSKLIQPSTTDTSEELNQELQYSLGIWTSESEAPVDNTLLGQFQVVDLNSSEFTTGIFGTELNNVFEAYNNTSTAPQ